MIPKRLSASSIKVYESCTARWSAEYIDKAPDSDNEAALLGTICHEALELFVNAANFGSGSWVFLEHFYHDAYWKHLDHGERYDEGMAMVKTWWSRTHEHLNNVEILANESWEEFNIPTTIGDLPFVYIIDRLERDDDGIHVVDYKTVSRPITPDQLHGMVQARLYAMAVNLQYPDEPGVWVEFDLLRYEVVGTYFSRDENRETYRWLRDKAQEIIDDDEPKERVNGECRFCVRRHGCEELRTNMRVGGVNGISLEVAVSRLDEARDRAAALGVLVKDLEEVILDEMNQRRETDLEVDGQMVHVTARKSRKLDQDRVSKIVGHDIMSEFGTLRLADVDALLKGDRLADDEKSLVRQAIRVQYGAPKPVIRPLERDY